MMQDGVSDDLDRYRILYDQAPACFHEIGMDGRLLSMNRAGLDMVGAESEEQIRDKAYLDFVCAPERERVQRLMDEAFQGQASEFEFLATGAPPLQYFSSCFIPCPDRDGKITRLIGISSNITSRKESEARIKALDLTHQLLSRSSCSLARSADEKALVHAFCHNVQQIGGYSFAWVGYAERDSSGNTRLQTCAGEVDALTAADLLNCPDAACPTPCASEIAVNRGETVLTRSSEWKKPYCDRWSEQVNRFGPLSVIALPLKIDGEILGSFTIFTTKQHVFNGKEVSLLEELAQILSQGIATMRSRAARQQKMLQFKNEVEQNERTRIAATLHDGIAQTMQAIKLGLNGVESGIGNDQQATRGLLKGVVDNVESVIEELRRISRNVRPLLLERTGFEEAVRQHCHALSQHCKTSIHVADVNQDFMLDDINKEQCFLSFREAINNAVRHAEASRIEVSMECKDSSLLSIQIRDDGVGFNTDHKFHLPSGLGFSMIAERMQSIGGHAEIHSSPGQGTIVTLIAPVKS